MAAVAVMTFMTLVVVTLVLLVALVLAVPRMAVVPVVGRVVDVIFVLAVARVRVGMRVAGVVFVRAFAARVGGVSVFTHGVDISSVLCSVVLPVCAQVSSGCGASPRSENSAAVDRGNRYTPLGYSRGGGVGLTAVSTMFDTMDVDIRKSSTRRTVAGHGFLAFSPSCFTTIIIVIAISVLP